MIYGDDGNNIAIRSPRLITSRNFVINSSRLIGLNATLTVGNKLLR